VEGEEILAKRPSHASVETRVSHWLAWHVDVKRREREREREICMNVYRTHIHNVNKQ